MKCDNCERTSAETERTLQRCARCKTVFYCSRDCQRQHWKIHKRVCKELAPAPAVKGGSSKTSASTSAAHADRGPPPSQIFWQDDAVPVECSYSSEKGRLLQSKREIPPGQLLLAAEAYAMALTKKERSRRCHYCCRLLPSDSYQRCKDCQLVFFCDKECTEAASLYHVIECEAIRHFSSDPTAFEYESEDDICNGTTGKGMSAMEFGQGLGRHVVGNIRNPDTVDEESGFLVLMIFCRALSEQKFSTALGLKSRPSRGVYHRWCFDDINDLWFHNTITDPYLRTPVNLIRDSLEKTMTANFEGKNPPILPSSDSIKKMFLRVRFNVHPLLDNYQKKFGIGIFPAAAYLNHSCYPNAVVYADGFHRRVIVRSIASIKNSEEITYAYINTYAPPQERQKLLMDGYKFVCRCQLCDPSGCPTHLTKSLRCGDAKCRGPMVVTQHHQPLRDSETDCRCVTLTCSPHILKDMRGVHSPASTPRDVFQCLVCGATSAQSVGESIEQDFSRKLFSAISMSNSNPEASMQALLELSNSDLAMKLHPLHMLQLDLLLASVSISLKVHRSEICEEATRKAIHMLASVNRREVLRIAWLGAAHSIAAYSVYKKHGEAINTQKQLEYFPMLGATSKSRRKWLEECLESSTRSYNTLKLVFGEDHELVEKSKTLAWKMRDAYFHRK